MTASGVVGRRARRGICVLLTTALVAGFWIIGDSAPASAWCNGKGNYQYLVYPVSTLGVPGEEWARAGTCDGDKVYYLGFVHDLMPNNGHCVFVQTFDGGVSKNMATSCNTAGTNFTYTDPGRDSQTFERVCESGGACTAYVLNNGY